MAMLFANDAKLTTLDDTGGGIIALYFGYQDVGVPVLISEEGGFKWMFRLAGEYTNMRDEGGTPLLSFGSAAVIFDPTSAIGDGDSFGSGALIISPDGPGIFEKIGKSSYNGGGITLISGTRKPFFRNRNAPAFARWAMGYMRVGDFVTVANVDASNRMLVRD